MDQHEFGVQSLKRSLVRNTKKSGSLTKGFCQGTIKTLAATLLLSLSSSSFDSSREHLIPRLPIMESGSSLQFGVPKLPSGSYSPKSSNPRSDVAPPAQNWKTLISSSNVSKVDFPLNFVPSFDLVVK